MNNRSIKK